MKTMKKIRLGIVGLGQRGYGLLSSNIVKLQEYYTVTDITNIILTAMPKFTLDADKKTINLTKLEFIAIMRQEVFLCRRFQILEQQY